MPPEFFLRSTKINKVESRFIQELPNLRYDSKSMNALDHKDANSPYLYLDNIVVNGVGIPLNLHLNDGESVVIKRVKNLFYITEEMDIIPTKERIDQLISDRLWGKTTPEEREQTLKEIGSLI